MHQFKGVNTSTIIKKDRHSEVKMFIFIVEKAFSRLFL